MNTTTDSEKSTVEKFSTISLDSSSKNTVRVLLNIVIIIILMALIIYAIVGTYIFYHKYVREGAAPVVEAAASSASEAADEIKKMLGGFVNTVRF